jgi:hypothetical protein
MVVLFVVLALTGCGVPTDLPSSAIVGSHSDGPISLPQIGGPAASTSTSGSAPTVGGAGSFPRSFLIPGTETSIRFGGS